MHSCLIGRVKKLTTTISRRSIACSQESCEPSLQLSAATRRGLAGHLPQPHASRLAYWTLKTFGGYTAQRRPVTLVFSQWFDRITDAIAAERQGKGWSPGKKETFVPGGFYPPPKLSKGGRRQGGGEGRMNCA